MFAELIDKLSKLCMMKQNYETLIESGGGTGPAMPGNLPVGAGGANTRDHAVRESDDERSSSEFEGPLLMEWSFLLYLETFRFCQKSLWRVI